MLHYGFNKEMIDKWIENLLQKRNVKLFLKKEIRHEKEMKLNKT